MAGGKQPPEAPGPLDAHFAAALDAIEGRGQRRRLDAAALRPGGKIERYGRQLLDFSSNDYLGLSQHPLLIERAAEWTELYGAGAGASRLVTGTSEAHLAVEAKIARFKGTEAAQACLHTVELLRQVDARSEVCTS